MTVSRFALALPILLAGCVGGSGLLADTDGDGLADSFEEEIGLDPDSSDTDGDGFSDNEEWTALSDPDNAESYPYTGGYDRTLAPDDLGDDGTGNEVGDVAEDFLLVDQFGDTVNLYSFYGQVILLKNSASWCGPCRSSEEEAEARYQNFRDDGFIQITLLGEDNAGQPPNDAALNDWADTPANPVTFPVVSDGQWGVGNRYERDGGIPTFSVVGRDMTLRSVDGQHGDAFIEELLAEDIDAITRPEAPSEDEVGDLPNEQLEYDYAGFDGAAGAPWGGASCNAAGGNAGVFGLLLGFLGLAIRRR